MARPAIAPTTPPSGDSGRASLAVRAIALALALLAGAASGAESTTDRVTRVDGSRRTAQTVPVLKIDEPDALASSAEVTELVVAAELCLRLPRFSREHGEQVDAWLLRNASLIDDVRRSARSAQAMAARLQAARRPLGREDQGPLESYCMNLAPRFLPKLPLIVGANAPRPVIGQPAAPNIVGTWRLISVTDTSSGEAISPALAYFSRYYPDGSVVYWTVPPTDVRRMTYQTEPEQMLLGGAPRTYGAKLQVTHGTMRFLNGAGGEQLHIRARSDLEPPIAKATAPDAKSVPPAAGSTPVPSTPEPAARPIRTP